MGFKFKLESVLTYTLSKEEAAKQEYLKVIAQQERAVDQMNYLKDELVREYQYEKIDISLLIAKSSYDEKVKLQLQQQIELVSALDRKAQGSKKKMTETFKERKTLEKLKQKHQEVYQKQQASVEQKFLDELALLAFLRN